MTITNTGRIAYQVGDQVRLNKPYQGHVLAQVTEVLDQNPNWVLISVAPFTIERRGRVATFRPYPCKFVDFRDHEMHPRAINGRHDYVTFSAICSRRREY